MGGNGSKESTLEHVGAPYNVIIMINLINISLKVFTFNRKIDLFIITQRSFLAKPHE